MRILISGALVMAGPFFAGFQGGAHAKDNNPVVTLQPMTGAHLPAGSQVSSERLRAMDLKIQEKLRARQQAPTNQTKPLSEGEQR
ncbi:MAG: hypothetical protein ACR2RE_09045 [Geminicoccaceae bacterium]